MEMFAGERERERERERGGGGGDKTQVPHPDRSSQNMLLHVTTSTEAQTGSEAISVSPLLHICSQPLLAPVGMCCVLINSHDVISALGVGLHAIICG